MKQNLAFNRKRKMLLILPLLVIPFLALAFHALRDPGGAAGKSTSTFLSGLSTELPAAHFNNKEAPKSKWDYYRKAQKDSAEASEQMISTRRLSVETLSEEPVPNEHEQTALIQEKLAQIEAAIELPDPEPEPVMAEITRPMDSISGISSDIDRLEHLMKVMQQPAEKDVELAQLDALVEKLLALQLGEGRSEKQEAVTTSPPEPFRAIPAIVVHKQKAVQGATIELKLLDSVTLSGQLIPKGHSVFGTCRITNQRLLLNIESIRLGTSIIPVDLTVYSLDGMPGINAPEAQLAGAAATGAQEAMRGIDLLGYDPGIASQVTGAGIDAAKDLLSRKLKRIKVKLDKGQRVLLRNNELKSY